MTDNTCTSGGSIPCTKKIVVYLNSTVVTMETGGAVAINGTNVIQYPHVGPGNYPVIVIYYRHLLLQAMKGLKHDDVI